MVAIIGVTQVLCKSLMEEKIDYTYKLAISSALYFILLLD